MKPESSRPGPCRTAGTHRSTSGDGRQNTRQANKKTTGQNRTCACRNPRSRLFWLPVIRYSTGWSHRTPPGPSSAGQTSRSACCRTGPTDDSLSIRKDNNHFSATTLDACLSGLLTRWFVYISTNIRLCTSTQSFFFFCIDLVKVENHTDRQKQQNKFFTLEASCGVRLKLYLH